MTQEQWSERAAARGAGAAIGIGVVSGGAAVAEAPAIDGAFEAVHKKASDWIIYYGNEPSAVELTLVELTLVRALTERRLTDHTVSQYDNGMSAVVVRLRKPTTMADAQARLLVRTTAEPLSVKIVF